jgi:hypothetical protein
MPCASVCVCVCVCAFVHACVCVCVCACVCMCVLRGRGDVGARLLVELEPVVDLDVGVADRVVLEALQVQVQHLAAPPR